MSENLTKTIKEIRKERLKNKNGNIKGECKENAEFLKQKLEEKGYEAEIIKGGINYKNEPTPKSYDEAKSSGTVHHWVLVKTKTSNLHCDICMEMMSPEEPIREILCSENPPSHYLRF